MDIEDNCSLTLLTIVARANAIITELYRLVELVPGPFLSGSQYHLDKSKRFTLDDIVCDFSYFKQTELFEAKIEANEELKRADELFCENYVDILTRFYLTFESVQRYAYDLNRFLVDLEDETFVGQSFEGLLQEAEGRQLLCEAYFLLGHMLLTTDNYFEGGLRERLIVGYYRYSSYKSSPDSCLDETCNIMRTTSYRSASQLVYKCDKLTSSVQQHHRPAGYPESLFARAGVNQSVVNVLIAKLQSVDIYNQTVLSFPHPDHRSAAFAQQASMLYVLLYFCPSILKTQRSRMREITDKFFSDNWVISVYMGELVSLIEAWEPYKAARESLYQLFDVETTRGITNQVHLKFYRVAKQLQEYLREGWLCEDSVLDNCNKILNQIREANMILKWLLLHSQPPQSWQLKLSKTLYSIVVEQQPDRAKLCDFLQNLAVLERKFASIYEKLMENRETKIADNKSKAIETLDDLIGIYNDSKSTRWIKPSECSTMSKILEAVKLNLVSLSLVEQNNCRDSIIKLINSLESSREAYSDGKCLQVTQLFMDLKESLMKILKYLGLPENLRVSLQSIGDISYAWRIMDVNFSQQMQQVIKENSAKIYGIESIFLKLASAFDTHLMRIQQFNAQADLISVSQYYSTKLISYIRQVLHIMPATILELVASIITLQTDNVLSEMPSKISLDQLKDYAMPEKRLQILEYTSKISHYAEAMVMMQNTCIGLIRINSKQLLEDGIRRELVRKMSDSIQNTLQFQDQLESRVSPIQLAHNLLNKLNRLNSIMSGYKRSFEYIQDYLFIYGLRMWQEELNRIIKFNVHEANLALIDEVANGMIRSPSASSSSSANNHQHQSMFQSRKAPIPTYSDNPLESSFVVRVVGELLKITNPRETIYDEQVGAWFEQRPPHQQVVDLKVFELLNASLGSTGLNGVDQMCCTLLMLELQQLDAYLFAGPTLNDLAEPLGFIDTWTRPHNTKQARQTTLRGLGGAVAKLAPHSERIVNHLLRIGQLQAIRMSISCVLSAKCRYEARNLHGCLETLNESLMSVLRRQVLQSGNKQNQQKWPNEDDDDDEDANAKNSNSDANLLRTLANGDSELVFQLTRHLEWVGLAGNPLDKIYTTNLHGSSSATTPNKDHQLAINLMFLVVLEQCSKFQFSRSICGFVPKQAGDTSGLSMMRARGGSVGANVDGQPLFYGLITLLEHYQPYLGISCGPAEGVEGLAVPARPIDELLRLLSLYVRCCLDLTSEQQASNELASIRPQDLTLELANAILGIVELLRLAARKGRQQVAQLPEYLTDTFQYAICHLN